MNLQMTNQMSLKNWNLVLGRVENIVGKGENAGYQHFLLFQRSFQKASISGLLRVGTVWQRVNWGDREGISMGTQSTPEQSFMLLWTTFSRSCRHKWDLKTWINYHLFLPAPSFIVTDTKNIFSYHNTSPVLIVSCRAYKHMDIF